MIDFITFEPWVWWALALTGVAIALYLADRYDEGRPASRTLDEEAAQDAVRPSPAPIETTTRREAK